MNHWRNAVEPHPDGVREPTSRRSRSRPGFAVVLACLLALACGCGHPRPENNGIRIAVAYEPETLDPHARNTISDYVITSHFYEPLVRISPDMRIQPVLADNWEAPDSYTWVLHLRPSVRFHNGKLLTSDDVVYSLRRVLNSDTLEMTEYLQNIIGVRALGNDAVEIKTSRPITILLNKLNFVAIVPAGSTAEELSRNVNGTGPFRLEEWQKGRLVKMRRNEAYWGKKADLQQVTFLIGKSPQEALELLISGQCDFAQCNLKKLEKAKPAERHFRLLRQDNLFLKYLSYNLSDDRLPLCSAPFNPFKDVRVRRAIHMAIDREQLTANLSCYAVPAGQIVPPFIFGYNPNIPAPRHDPVAARRLLAEAGLPEGFRVQLHTRRIFSEPAHILARQLRQVGILIDVVTLPDPDFFRLLNNRRSPFFLSRYGCPTGDASNILDNVIHSTDRIHNYGRSNQVGYKNKEVDDGIEESAEIQQVDRRRTVLQDVMAKVMEDLPWIPLYIDQDVFAVDKRYSWQPRNDSYIFAWEINIVE